VTTAIKQHLLYSSGDPQEVQELNEVIQRYPNVPVSFVRQGPLLKDWEELPFLDTTTGEHIVGLDSISDYLSRQARA